MFPLPLPPDSSKWLPKPFENKKMDRKDHQKRKYRKLWNAEKCQYKKIKKLIKNNNIKMRKSVHSKMSRFLFAFRLHTTIVVRTLCGSFLSQRLSSMCECFSNFRIGALVWILRLMVRVASGTAPGRGSCRHGGVLVGRCGRVGLRRRHGHRRLRSLPPGDRPVTTQRPPKNDRRECVMHFI